MNLATILNEIEQIFKIQLNRKQLAFDIEYTTSLPDYLLLDEVRLRQVLLNVVGNAVKFTETGGIRILISSQENETGTIDLQLEIEDSGIGIPEKDIDNIFKSFRQQSGNYRSNHEGTGLGLSISSRLLEIMGGTINVQSTPGRGSTFTISLGGVEISNQQMVEPDIRTGMGDIRFARGKILVVDDVDSNRQLLNELLSMVNLDVLVAENGHEAILIASEFKPDAILMDIRMPVMNGYEAAEQLKSSSNTAAIPIIAITASTSTMDRKKIMERNFSGFVPKPIEIDALFAELKKYYTVASSPELHTRQSPTTGHELPDLTLPGMRENLGAAITILEQDVFNSWLEFRKRQPIQAVKSFATRIRVLGKTHQLDMVETYGKSLEDLVKNFDIARMRTALENFPDLIQSLKQIGGNPDDTIN